MGQGERWGAAGLGHCSWAAWAVCSFCWVQAAGMWLCQAKLAVPNPALLH